MKYYTAVQKIAQSLYNKRKISVIYYYIEKKPQNSMFSLISFFVKNTFVYI